MAKSKDKSNVQYKLTLDQIREIIKHSNWAKTSARSSSKIIKKHTP